MRTAIAVLVVVLLVALLYLAMWRGWRRLQHDAWVSTLTSREVER